MKASNTILSALLVAGAAVSSAPADAKSVTRTAINHSVTACEGTTPAYASLLQSSPSGVRNVSSQDSAVVLCGGVATSYNNYGDVISWEASISNFGASDVTINCSLDDGMEDFTGYFVTSYPKAIVVPAGSTEYFSWNGLDTGGTTWSNGPRFEFPSMTCELPANTEIGYTGVMFNEDIGL